MSRAEPPLMNLANLLTFSRLLLAPVVWGLMALGHSTAAAGLFLAAAITDWLDGLAARRLQVGSALGRQLDPLVDKILVIGCYVYALAVVPNSGLYPWMIAAIVTRELTVQAIRSLIEGRGAAFGAKFSGKLKTVLQFAAIVGILLVQSGRLSSSWTIARDVLIWSSVLLTIGSGVHYLVLAGPMLAEASPAPPLPSERSPR